MRLEFSKYEGLGNDFLVVDAEFAASALGALTPARVVALCDRHRGVGADGILVVRAAGPRFFMKVFNADGSVPEMCGNGIRCAALALYREADRIAEFEILTDAGLHRCRIVHGDSDAAEVEVHMRPPSLQPRDLPVRASSPLIEQVLEGVPADLRWTAVSMGNPHAVTFDEPAGQHEALARQVERHAWFPKGVNVGMARVMGDQALELRVWERGVGWTEACGTGACAAAVAAVQTGRAKRGQPLHVRLPGGTLTLRVGGPGESCVMTGPARHVFDGQVELRET